MKPSPEGEAGSDPHPSRRRAHHSTSPNKNGSGHGAEMAVKNYHDDTDDEEVVESTRRLPKYALELIANLEKEEENIDGDDIDPILLTKIRAGSRTYEFIRGNGTKQLFRAGSLIDYMLTTRHFHDPETRIEFTDDQLVDLDKIGTELGKESVLVAKLDGVWLKQKLEDDEDAFAGVERCAGEHISEMIRLIERTRKTHAQDAEMELLCRVFPFFRYYVSLMFGLDREATGIAVDQFRRFLIGPPNRPTVDKSRVLLKFCLDFFDEVMRDLWISYAASTSSSYEYYAQ
jgi:hypothetical protein